MTIVPGTRLGPYEVTTQIGVGGMGEVYKATDTNLKRAVAIKVLPASLAADAERLARFQREAEVLASLNHPNIAAIYGLERASGMTALVMELVEGPTLADRIAQGPFPVDEALPIAKQIAEALEAAHEQGIIHRDLKPANIKVRPDGTVKVLDFGLAKAMEPTGVMSPGVSQAQTITSPAMMTGVGMILGTAAYMSPEQARGKPVDKRADVWAFGCVLFEMLTGHRPFDGEDMTEVLGAVVRLEPPWDALPSDVPVAVRTLLQSCLVKDPRHRVTDISIALFVLDKAASLAAAAAGHAGPHGQDPPSVQTQVDAAVSTARRETAKSVRWRAALVGAAAVVVTGVIVGVAVWWATRPAPPRVLRTEITTAGAAALSMQGNSRDLAITPDGSRIVYRGTNQVLVRALDQLEPDVLSGLGAPRDLFVSPDGEWIGFFDGAASLKKVAITGGPPVAIAPVDGTGPRGATWGPHGTVVYATAGPATGLQRVSASGGDPTALTTPNRERGELDHLWPEFLPGGQAVLFTITAVTGGLENAQVAVLDLQTNTQTVLVRGGSHAQYMRTGHLVYGAGGTLRAVAFDLARLAVVGTPVPVLEQVAMTALGGVQAVAAANGTMVYVAGAGATGPLRTLVWKTRAGGEESVPAPPHEYESLQLSPDGSRAVIQIVDQARDIWVWDFARQTLTRLTFSPDNDYDPAWTPDGRRVVFSREGSLFWRPADGTGAEERVTPGVGMLPTSFSPDGKQLIVSEQNDIKLVAMDGKRDVTPLLTTMFSEGRAYLSSDGRWLAYQSNESGQYQIYVQPFPDLGAGRWQVSATGGTEPAWARNGRELFYLNGEDALVSVSIQTQPTFSAGKPTTLFDAPYFPVTGTRRYDVTSDGQRFLFIKNDTDQSVPSATSSLVVIQNWFEELKRLVPTN